MGQGLNVPAILNLTCRGWFSNSPSRKYFGLGNEIQKWGFYSALNFLIPDIYILAFARHVPKDTYYIFFAVVGVLAAFSIAGVVQQIRTYNAEHREENE